jgi:glucose/arabinose dehydrogenase
MKTFRRAAAVCAAVLLMVAIGRAQQAPANRAESTNSRKSDLGPGPWTFQLADYRVQVSRVISNLDRPYSVAFLPDGGMLITERAGRIRLVKNGVLDPTPITGVPKVMFKDFDGLEDISLHPRFAENHLVYFTYSKPSEVDGGGVCALARGRYEGGYELKDVKDLFVGRSENPRPFLQIITAHIVWGKDGMIYMTCADTWPRLRFQAQDPSSHRGKVLRLKDDGTAPADNPLIGKTDYGIDYLPEIYTSGHRDGMSLAFNPVSGELFETENGPQGGDELNILKPGKNYGWPLISFGRDYGGAPIPQFMAGMEMPFTTWTPSIAPAHMMFYTGDKFPKWKNNLFVAALIGARIERLAFNAKGLPTRTTGGNTEFLLWELHQRIRYVTQGPDGFMYVLTDYDNGALLRIEPMAAAPATASR